MNSAEITYVIVSRRCLLLILPCAEQPLATPGYTSVASKPILGFEKKFRLFAGELFSTFTQADDGLLQLDYMYYVNDIVNIIIVMPVD